MTLVLTMTAIGVVAMAAGLLVMVIRCLVMVVGLKAMADAYIGILIQVY